MCIFFKQITTYSFRVSIGLANYLPILVCRRCRRRRHHCRLLLPMKCV